VHCASSRMATPAAPAAVKGPQPLLIRVLMIGESSVGKTSLVLRYDKRGFNAKFTTTIGVDYSDRMLTVEDKQVKLQIWDTAGQVS
jgi:small GTP-binding protein